ncbi:MAG TPA: AMP-binding protein, partial [Dehalococcoidia bacterium]|nr:AMP-binding protein [Dehalococcoidia bacterium]
VGGLAILLRSVIYGIPAVVHAAFDPARVNRAIDEEGVTIVSVVANMLQRMLDERHDRPFPDSLRCLLLGGGPAPEALLRRCAAVKAPVVQTYGLTEAASQVSTLSPEDALRKLGSAGKPLFGTELRILDDAGRDCPPGVAGEIAVRGPTVTPGYLKDSAATASALRDGWLHTGDAGYLDAEGYLYVLDRRDDLIISGGENVYPAEVEAVLASHPDVAEAGVFAIADERWGRAPAAAVVLRPGAAVTAEALIGFCRERLARYKTPVRVHVVQTLPRNASGKLLRRELRERLGS